MEEALKKRLIGAVTLVALAVIFIPPLLEQSPHKPLDLSPPPPVPDKMKQGFSDVSINEPVRTPQVPGHILNPPVAVAPEPEAPELAATRHQNTQAAAKPTAPEKLPDKQAAPADTKPTTQKPTTPPDLQAWVIQAASFSQRDNAQKLAKRLRNAGFQVPDLEVVQIQDKLHYRVKVGPMLEKSTAEQSLAKISALSGSNARLVPHRP